MKTLRGEFWITETSTISCDRDVEVYNHEMVAQEHARELVLDVFGVERPDTADGFLDPDTFLLALGGLEPGSLGKTGVVESGLIPIALGGGDAIDWAVAKWGWIKVNKMEVQVRQWDNDTFHHLAAGLEESVDMYGKDPSPKCPITINVWRTGKRYTMTWQDIAERDFENAQETPLMFAVTPAQVRAYDTKGCCPCYRGNLGD